MKDQPELSLNIPMGKTVKAWCKCGSEVECELKTFSNGTKHAYGTCLKCGLTNYKQQRLPGDLEDIKHALLGVYAKINAISGLDRDEAICMVERMVDELWRNKP